MTRTKKEADIFGVALDGRRNIAKGIRHTPFHQLIPPLRFTSRPSSMGLVDRQPNSSTHENPKKQSSGMPTRQNESGVVVYIYIYL